MVGKGPTNPVLLKAISGMVALSVEKQAPVWKTVADELAKPARRRPEVNLSRLERFCKDGDVVAVPGKVLASGTLSKKLTVAAWNFSSGAGEKIKKAGGKALALEELAKANPEGSGVRLMK